MVIIFIYHFLAWKGQNIKVAIVWASVFAEGRVVPLHFLIQFAPLLDYLIALFVHYDLLFLGASGDKAWSC